MNASNNFDKTDGEYSPAPSDDLIGFWRSKVKVTAGRRGGDGIYVDTVALKSVYFLGRLFDRVDLIKPISSVCPYVHPVHPQNVSSIWMEFGL